MIEKSLLEQIKMKRGVLTLFVVTSLGFVVGCPVVPAPGPEAVLEGTWSITPADPGEFEGFTVAGRPRRH